MDILCRLLKAVEQALVCLGKNGKPKAGNAPKKLYEIIREVPNEQVQLKSLENDWGGNSQRKVHVQNRWNGRPGVSTVSKVQPRW